VPIQSLDSDQLDMARHAIDVTVCDTIGSSNLTDVLRALSSPNAGPAIGEARQRVRLAAKITQAQLIKPDWVPNSAFHPVGFDLSVAWGPSALRLLGSIAALISQSTTEPQARIKRRSIHVISRTIPLLNASLIRARPSDALSQPCPTWAPDGITRIPFV
jgi:hypothetical protein